MSPLKENGYSASVVSCDGWLCYMLALIHISRKSVGKKGILRRSPLLEYSVEKGILLYTWRRKTRRNAPRIRPLGELGRTTISPPPSRTQRGAAAEPAILGPVAMYAKDEALSSLPK